MATDSTARDPHALLEHAAWLRRLALSLVRDAAAADDLVQETWVAALRRPPADDRPLRPWLRRVIENAARFRWRGERNRGAREELVAAVAEDAMLSSEELLERHEMQQLLARLVRELDEPYRSTILLRYAEGLEPTEIARRQGVPAGTVRWRVKEGLDRLRARLDDAHHGDRRAWMLALAPLAKAGGVWGSPWVPLVVVALLFAIVMVVARGARTASDDRAPRAGAETMLPAARVDRSALSTNDAVLARVREIAANKPPGWFAQESVAPRRVAGRVVDGDKPAAGVLVRLTSELSLAGLVPALEQRTDASGRFDFGEQIAREYAVGAAAPDRLAAVVRIDLRHPSPATAPDALELALLPCAAAIHGVVKDAGGSPVAHASILREDVIGIETGADGRYELCVWPSAAHVDQLHVVVRADGYGTVMLEAAPSGRVRRDIVLTPEAVIAGRVVDERGAPLSLAKVWIEPDVEGRRPPSEQSATMFAVTGDDGRFRIAGVLGGRHRIAAVGRGLTAERQSVAVAAGASVDIVLAMAATGRVRGRVLLDGAPVAGARVRVYGELSDSAVSQVDGSFVLDRVRAGETRLTARPYDVKGTDTVTVAGGADAEVDLHVARMASIRGTVRRHGVPVPYARIDFGGPTQIGTHADGQGRYLVEGLRPGVYGYLADDARRGAFVDGQGIDVAEGETRVLDLELVSGARVTGTVVDGAGRPVAGAVVRLVAAGGDEGRCATDDAGAFDCAQMTGGGAYEAHVYVGDDASVPYPFVGPAPAPVALADGDARVDGVRLVVDPRRLAITGTVTDAAGTPIADARVQALGAVSSRYRWTTPPSAATDVDGAFTIASLAPGAYTLEVAGIDGSRSARRQVDAGETGVTLVVERPTCNDPTRSARLRDEPPGITTRPAARVVWGEGGERIELLGWDAPATVRRGEPFTITTYYRTLAPLDRAWTIFVHIDSATARHLGDHEPLGGTCPSSTWQPGDILVDRFTTTINPAHIPAGRFAIWIGFFTGWAPNWRNFEVHAAPADMKDSVYRRIKIADLIVE